MYAVCINDDNIVSTLVNQRIYQGYKLADWFWFLQKPFYNGKQMSKYDASIRFTLPVSKKVIIEKITLKDDSYEGYLKYALSSRSKLTNESGVVLVKVIFSDSDENIIRETSEFKVPISTTVDWHDDDSFNESTGNGSGNSGSESSGGNCNCDNEEHLREILAKTKPLIFESVNDAETQLNSGKITDLYYGQAVVIKINGKYVSYTIQKGSNGYVVEPVDTVGTGTVEGLFWQENN